LGLAILAGAITAISLRVLGAAKELPLQPLARFFRLMWGDFVRQRHGTQTQPHATRAESMNADRPWTETVTFWLEGTLVSQFMNWSWWAWPVAECLHFTGLTLLFGTVGLFDLRVLGFVRELPPALLHRLVPWGVAGCILSAVTGSLFITGIPGMYLGNPAFWTKVALLAAGGLNVLTYYLTVGRQVAELRGGESAPPLAKVLAATSLTLWIAVLIAGRLIGFYKP